MTQQTIEQAREVCATKVMGLSEYESPEHGLSYGTRINASNLIAFHWGVCVSDYHPDLSLKQADELWNVLDKHGAVTINTERGMGAFCTLYYKGKRYTAVAKINGEPFTWNEALVRAVGQIGGGDENSSH